MRSTFKTITIATFALSIAAGGAFAAGMPAHSSPWPDMAGSGDYTTMAPTPQAAMPLPMAHHTRLDRVLGELGSAQQSIRRDEAMHRLSASAYRKLEGEAGGIRARALAVADTHHGTIPQASYQRLQRDIRKLDRDIVRLS